MRLSSLPAIYGTEDVPGPDDLRNGLVDRVLSVPSFRRRYLERMTELLDGPFASKGCLESLEARALAQEEDARIDVEKWTRERFDLFLAEVDTLMTVMGDRESHLRASIASLMPPARVDLAINELVMAGDDTSAAVLGVELHFRGRSPIDVAGFHLSDDPDVGAGPVGVPIGPPRMPVGEGVGERGISRIDAGGAGPEQVVEATVGAETRVGIDIALAWPAALDVRVGEDRRSGAEFIRCVGPEDAVREGRVGALAEERAGIFEGRVLRQCAVVQGGGGVERVESCSYIGGVVRDDTVGERRRGARDVIQSSSALAGLVPRDSAATDHRCRVLTTIESAAVGCSVVNYGAVLYRGRGLFTSDAGTAFGDGQADDRGGQVRIVRQEPEDVLAHAV